MTQLYSNPNDARRGRNIKARYSNRPVITEAEMEVGRVNTKLRHLEADIAERFSRRHMLEVFHYMPHIRRCRIRGRAIRRVPKDVLTTVRELCLVVEGGRDGEKLLRV